MSESRWKKGAPAGMAYGFAFNDHLQALTAAATAKMKRADEDERRPAETAQHAAAATPKRD